MTVATESMLLKADFLLVDAEPSNNVSPSSRFQTYVARVGIANATTILSTGTSSFDW
jgi:hypothetical protein